MAPWILKTEGFEIDSFPTLYATKRDVLIALGNFFTSNWGIILPANIKNNKDWEITLRCALKQYVTNRTPRTFHIRDIAKVQPVHQENNFIEDGWASDGFSDYVSLDDDEVREEGVVDEGEEGSDAEIIDQERDYISRINELEEKIKNLEEEKTLQESKRVNPEPEVFDLTQSPLTGTWKRQRRNR